MLLRCCCTTSSQGGGRADRLFESPCFVLAIAGIWQIVVHIKAIDGDDLLPQAAGKGPDPLGRSRA